MHCHHEKLVIVDDELAFVGGIDLTALAGDRYDGCEHAYKPEGIGWHDASSAAAGAGRPRRRRTLRAALGGERRRRRCRSRRPLPSAGDTTLQLVRTMPEGAYPVLPRGEFSILEAYVRALRSAQHLIYLENQFLWSPEIVAILESKLKHPPSDDFRIVVLLPHKANNGQDDTRGMLGRLVAADGGANRLLATTIFSRTGEQSGSLYVHAKIGIVDDAWLAIGSANLNEHSLFNDSEVDVIACDPALARATRLRLWEEHLEGPADGDPYGDHRLEVAPDRLRAARAPAPRRAAHAPPRRAPRRFPALPPLDGTPGRARRRRLEDDRAVAVHEDSVLQVRLDRAGEHRALDVAAEADHRLGMLAV